MGGLVRRIGDSGSRSSTRYKKVNFNTYPVYGTIEFRQHSGSIDFAKISNWVLLTHLMMQRAEGKKVTVTEARAKKWQISSAHTMFDFYRELGINGSEIAEYVRGRRASLNLEV